ncbi:MAG: radical SAM protein [Anaerolineae bacterium]|nr:radical SAM protein [Anaerolineae bacterium]MDW8069438.1 radical SAM protein [Anaerolineae bacterium]
MDPVEKLRLLGPATCYEPAEEVSLAGRWLSAPAGLPPDLSGCIYYAAMPGGRRIPLLKTLLTSVCERDCFYCAFRAGRDCPRATFTPDELARLFFQLYQRGMVEGLFLSSSILGSGPHTQDRLIAAAEILRHRYGFRGYIHLKIMPGAERDQVAAAMRLANRVSVNLEAPNDRCLAALAPHKQYTEELLQRLRWIAELRREWPGPAPSATTQFVVGAAGESDRELLRVTAVLYRHLGLARAYFQAFHPVPGTPMEHHPPASPVRAHRLYQASFLLRDYGFGVEELPFRPDGNLPLEVDPKLAWAREHLLETPVEVNRAGREALLRVPGIGPRGADRLIAARRRGRLRDLRDLRALGIAADRAAPFILLDGRRPACQMALF